MNALHLAYSGLGGTTSVVFSLIEGDKNKILNSKIIFTGPKIHKDYKIVIDNIKRALDLCSPLRNLPIEKYDSWKEIILQFDVGKDSN
jgi:hypothetical protein